MTVKSQKSAVDLSINSTEMSLEKESSSDEHPKNNLGEKIKLDYIED
jgi:hypothetical protein